MSLGSGARLGPYGILSKLGEGGMGEVYRAHDPRLGRDVALKILPESMARDAEGLQRFTREARALAALNHPHIVTIFSTEESEGIRFLTMELVEGRTLDQMIPSGGMSMAKFFDVATALADALAGAHQRQITHRDLKPGNVMVTDDGRVKVLDFGLSGHAAADAGTADDATRLKLTQAGTILGTRPYMSPEQIEARPLDGRSDLFSLGIVLYEMATGRRPFLGDTSASLMSSIMKDHPRPVTELRLDLPEGVARIVTRCLEKSPRDRIQSAQEILIELRAQRRAWESGSTESRQRSTSASSSSHIRPNDLRIAVLPFASRTPGGDAEALAEGLTDDITVGLARFPYLRVVARHDVEAAKGRAADARSAALVGARYLLDGTLRTSAGSVRIAVRLVDAETGAHLWAENYDRSLGSVFDLQDDLTNRLVSTVGDSDGVLVRSMAGAVRPKPIEALTLDELVLRYFGFIESFRADEHLRLRAGFERALEVDAQHALAWGCLSDLYNCERVFGFNPLPDSATRAWRAAERSIEIEPACQFGWRQIALRHHDDRDLHGLRMAAERTIQLNPLSTSAPFVGMLLAFAGDWDRGMAIIRRAMDLNRQHAGWYHFSVFTDHFRKGEFEEALAAAKATNTHSPLTPIAIAAAAGELGRNGDASAAVDTIRRRHPACLEHQGTRGPWASWIWDDGLVDRLVDSFEKALALAGSGTKSTASGAVQKPPSGAISAGSARSDRTLAGSVTRDLSTIVVPFVVQGTDAEVEALARGLSEDVATGLSRFQFFSVQTASDADTRYRVEGSVRRAGDLVRASVRVIDVDSGVHLWAQNYDRSLKETSIFDLQDDLTARVVAAVADGGGVFVKAMGTPLRERPVEDLSVDELVVRYHLYATTSRIDEHARLRTAFERAVEARPNHAAAWACLAALCDHELSLGLNTQPGAVERGTRAARRSVEIDPACQLGWSRLMAAHYHAYDTTAWHQAAERIVAINPLNQGQMAYVGMAFAVSGEWDRGIPMVRRAMDVDPNIIGVLHIVLFADYYRRREYEEALARAKRLNAPETALSALSLAAAAGQLGRAEEARAALDALRRDHPGHDESTKVRALWAYWLREPELIERLLEGFENALRLAGSGSQQSSSGRSASIAVLPFTDLSAARDQEWFCDGIAEEILTTLSQVKGLTVAARASAFSFRGRGDDLAAIGDKLHVTTVLDGSVRRAGDRLRITVRLSDVANGYQIWSERYDRDVRDVFDVQDEIARAIAERLRVGLGGDAAPRVVRHTENQEAYHLYLRARHLWYSRSKGGLLRARQLLEEAIEKDPEYSLAYVGLAELFLVQSLYGFEREEIANAKARTALDRAMAINDRIADAHRAVGLLNLFLTWDMKAAVRAFERSVELDPTSGLAHVWLGWPAWPGRESVAIAAARRAQALDPLNPYVHSLSGAIHERCGHGEDSLRQFDKAFEIDPNTLVGLYLGGGAYSRLGRHDDALRLFSRAVDLSDRAPFYVSYDAWARARAGRIDEARASLAELEARAASEYVQPLQLAIVHAALGDMDRAFERLDDAVRLRNGWIGSPAMPMFEDFRRDPRFVQHLRRIGYPVAESAG
jgi:serine/threonine-protein kinase